MGSIGIFLVYLMIALCLLHSASAATRHYKFEIKMQNVTRLCHTKSMVTVNGKFPGPPIVAREGDRLEIKVINHVQNNISIHWHGIRQLHSAWADGPAYVTQCPIQIGQSYVYNFTIIGQRGTFWWHAHISWLRSTLYGPIIILPKKNTPYPFAKPYKEVPVIFGEWFNADTEAIIAQALQTGGGPNVSDAYTINGLPGPSYNCSSKDTFNPKVKHGKTYLLRPINAALNDELFFALQTIPSKLSMPMDPAHLTTLRFFGILEYESKSKSHLRNLPLFKPLLPALNDTNFVTNFTSRLRSLATPQFPANVPLNIDKRLFFTIGLGTSPCDQNKTCQGPNGTKFSASINNVSFILPGVYKPHFPYSPLHWFNFTGSPPNNTLVNNDTKLMVLPFNTSVELVLQDTSILGLESHPLHLHGFNFFVVGQGFGNFDPNKDPSNFNLVDPIERNTVGVPYSGWVAIRFLADNPGVWFMHCHLEVHTSWGLKMAWLVLDGKLPNQKLPLPPMDLPKC
ncbi:unnamed protein product [Withania somnifera]